MVMTTTRIPINGGPADGESTYGGGRFVWLEVVVRRRSQRTSSAGLYEMKGDRYVYVGGHAAQCECGGYVECVEARERCPMCGKALT